MGLLDLFSRVPWCRFIHGLPACWDCLTLSPGFDVHRAEQGQADLKHKGKVFSLTLILVMNALFFFLATSLSPDNGNMASTAYRAKTCCYCKT